MEQLNVESWVLLNIWLAQEGGLTTAKPTWMNQQVLHSQHRSFCNNLKLTPPESVLMFVWKPFYLTEVLFSSVNTAINSCTNIYLSRKVFSLFQLSSFLHFLQQKKKTLSFCFSSFQIGGKRECPAILQICNRIHCNGWAVISFLVWLEVAVQWWACGSCRLYSSQLARTRKGPNHFPKTSYKMPATVCLQAEY